MGIFSKLFKKECQHNWQIEPPTHNVGEALKVWEGPVEDVCTKCGARRRHPECVHEWQPIEDDGKGCYVNGIKLVGTKKCSKCGAQMYEEPE